MVVQYEVTLTGTERESKRSIISAICGQRGYSPLGWSSPERTWGSDKWVYAPGREIDRETLDLLNGFGGIEIRPHGIQSFVLW